MKIKLSSRNYAYILVVLVIAGLLSVYSKAEAHVVKVDNSIGAMFHIEPNDEPSIAKPSTIKFHFKDTNNALNLYKCDCRLSIVHNNQILFSEKFHNSNDMSMNSKLVKLTYIFTSKGIYTILVEGKPSLGNQFQSFKLSYDIPVDKKVSSVMVMGTSVMSHTEHFMGIHLIHMAFYGGAILICLIVIIQDQIKNRRNKKNINIQA